MINVHILTRAVVIAGLLLPFFSCTVSSAQEPRQVTEDTPIRLEATIRADKEQPRVMSIVPWQLPRHRQIEGTLTWSEPSHTLTPIERTQFLRELALAKQFGMQVLTNP